MDQLIGLVTLMTGVGVFFFVALRVIIADTPVDWQSAKSAAPAKSASTDAGMNSATMSTTLTSMDSSGSVSTSCGHDSGFSSHC